MRRGLAFDDVLMVPQYSEVLPQDTDTSVMLGTNIKLNLPVMSAAMDTVTETDMAIAMAREGGIGIIHQNMSTDEQLQMVKRVKNKKQRVIEKPVTVSPKNSLGYARSLLAPFDFNGAPVIDPETDQLVGMLTSRDMLAGDRHTLIEDVMSKKLICGYEEDSFADLEKRMLNNRIEKLPFTDDDGRLLGLVTLRDLQERHTDTLSTIDIEGRYRVGASVGVGNIDAVLSHVMDLYSVGVDLITIDSAHGHSKGVMDLLGVLCKEFPELLVVVGNIVTKTGAHQLINKALNSRNHKGGSYANNVMLKVGIGPGSICTTRSVAGVGYPQLSALMNCTDTLTPTTFIADGGINKTGSIPKALMFSNCVMLGQMLAGTDEAPGEITEINGKLFKKYRGMGSSEAMEAKKATGNRYSQKKVAEGVSGLVPYKGSVRTILSTIRGALQSSLGYMGTSSIEELQELGDRSDDFLVELSPAAKTESDVSTELIV